MRVEAFDFELPEALIALRPASPRDSARMLVVDGEGRLHDQGVADLMRYLNEGDALVFNDTKVIRARLCGTRTRVDSSATIEVTLHQRVNAARWRAFAKPAKRLRVGDVILFGENNPACEAGRLAARVIDKGDGGEVLLGFDLAGPVLDDALQAAGQLPLPPYIAAKRATDAEDEVDYQTIYARAPGAVAAPTAGLHFTERMIDDMEREGIQRHFVTLHVGAGTFLPVKVDDTEGHRMHAETGEIDVATAEALNKVRANGGRIIAVGTTSLRLLESAAMPDGTIKPFQGETDIFITPGHRFKVVDVLMTNFHLPRSTLFMLVSAFCGLDTMRAAYAHAIAEGYRFYSYGDASLLYRAT